MIFKLPDICFLQDFGGSRTKPGRCDDLWGGKRGKRAVSPSDSLHRCRLEFLNPRKSFIPVRKCCFGCLEQRDGTGGIPETCLRLPAVPLKAASMDHKKPQRAGL